MIFEPQITLILTYLLTYLLDNLLLLLLKTKNAKSGMVIELALGRYHVLGVEIALIGLLLGFHWWFSILAHRKMLVESIEAVGSKIQNLDEALGEAIEMVSNSSMQGQNPLVGVLSQVLMENLTAPKIEAKVIQGEDGKFVKKNE